MTEATEDIDIAIDANNYDLDHGPSVLQLQDFLADIASKRRQLLSKRSYIRNHRKFVLLTKLLKKVAAEHCRLQQLERRRIRQEMLAYVCATGVDCNRPPPVPRSYPVRVNLHCSPVVGNEPGPAFREDKSSWMKLACHRLRSIFRDIWSRVSTLMRQVQRLWKSDNWSNLDE